MGWPPVPKTGSEGVEPGSDGVAPAFGSNGAEPAFGGVQPAPGSGGVQGDLSGSPFEGCSGRSGGPGFCVLTAAAP